MTKSKKNILIVTNLHVWSLDAGKGGKAFFHTVSGYIDKGWNVYLISTGGGIPDSMRDKIQAVEKQFPTLLRWHNSSNKLLSVIGRFLKLAAFSRFYVNAARKIINQHPGEKFVVYAYEVEGVKGAKRIARKFDLPLVTRFQGTVLAREPQHWLHRLKRTPHFSALSTRADLVVMTNDGTKGLEVLQRLGNTSKEIVFWRNGVDPIVSDAFSARETTRKKWGYSDNHTVFITVSRLNDWKRVNLAIDAFAKVIKTNPDSRLLIVGDGPERASLEAQADRLRIQDQITFAGAVQQKEVQYLLAASDIFCSYYDLSNLGNPLMEAMMVGLPIITIDVGDTRELIKNNINGLLIPADALDTVPDCMEHLLTNKDLRLQLARGSKTTAAAEFWNWEERMQAEIEKVEKLLSEPHSW